VSSFFTCSGGSPPRFHQSPLSSARIGVPTFSKASPAIFDLGMSRVKRIFKFNLTPIGERIRALAEWCICKTATGLHGLAGADIGGMK
jgi:hypothetical protein